MMKKKLILLTVVCMLAGCTYSDVKKRQEGSVETSASAEPIRKDVSLPQLYTANEAEEQFHHHSSLLSEQDLWNGTKTQLYDADNVSWYHTDSPSDDTDNVWSVMFDNGYGLLWMPDDAKTQYAVEWMVGDDPKVRKPGTSGIIMENWRTASEQIISETMKDGQLEIITALPHETAEQDYGKTLPDGVRGDYTARITYQVDPESLDILSYQDDLINANGEAVRYSSTTITRDANNDQAVQFLQKIREFTTDASDAVEQTVIMDPGTDQEKSYTASISVSVPVQVSSPDGYAAYEDAAGTIPFGSSPQGSSVMYLLPSDD